MGAQGGSVGALSGSTRSFGFFFITASMACTLQFGFVLLACSLRVGTAEESCCECIKGTDMGSDLVSFSGDVQDCSTCCKSLRSEYHSGKSLSDSTCQARLNEHASCSGLSNR